MKFLMEKGRRLTHRFRDVCSDHLWWDSRSKTWATMEDHKVLGNYPWHSLSSHSGTIRTIRAFRRHLRKYGVPGVKYELCSRFVGHNVIAMCRRKK